jgi:hypothetical protein
MKAVILAGLLAALSTVAHAQPRHIYRDGNYFFCPYPDFDPWCREPNDYSVPLHPQPYYGPAPVQSQPGPPVLLAPGLPPALGALADRAIRNALRPRHQAPPAPPQMSMQEEREAIIRQGEEHCRKFPQDTQVCHPPR